MKGSVTHISIAGGDTIPTVPVTFPDDDAHWSADALQRPMMLVDVARPGDFSTYTLSITSDNLDPFFSHSRFSFKAACPSDLDCAAPGDTCPPEKRDLPPIDYLAKDFRSFRKARSVFARESLLLPSSNWRIDNDSLGVNGITLSSRDRSMADVPSNSL